MTSNKFIPKHFIEESIDVIFGEEPLLEKSPKCPQGFIWRERKYRISKLLAEWRDYQRKGRTSRNMKPQHAAVARSRGSWGVGIFYFRVLVETGEIFDIYYDRAPKNVDSRKGFWFLYQELSMV
jgi:hypothetical protein